MKQEPARETDCAAPEIRVSRLPFSRLPGQSKLFLDYLSDPVSLREFFPNAVASPADVGSMAADVLAAHTVDRTLLCDALAETAKSVNAPARSLLNIGRLRDRETVAVVTGQQAGLLGGPLYTIYKALSAIKVADELSASGVPAVPVFWGATEDHDFAEVAEAFVLDDASRVLRIPLPTERAVPNASVGATEFTAEMRERLYEGLDRMPRTQFSDALRGMIDECWLPGTDFGTAFGRTIIGLLGDRGLIYLEPRHRTLKRLTAPLVRSSIERRDDLTARVMERGRALRTRGYHEQVLYEADHFPLFWHDDSGGRWALRRTESGRYKAKDHGETFDAGDLERIAQEEPERFSPAAMLRPVVQDYLLPTICYFGGGAEISYFAQNSVIYEVLGRPVTPIFHRQSVTIVERRHRRTLDKLGWEVETLFGDPADLRIAAAAQADGVDAGTAFAQAEEIINGQMNRLDQLISELDPTLARNLATRRRKIVYHIGALQRKALAAKLRKDHDLDRRLNSLLDSLAPNGQLQERVLNVFALINALGPGVIDTIADRIDLSDTAHRILEL